MSTTSVHALTLAIVKPSGAGIATYSRISGLRHAGGSTVKPADNDDRSRLDRTSKTQPARSISADTVPQRYVTSRMTATRQQMTACHMSQDERQSSESDWPTSANRYLAVATRPAETPPGDVISMDNHPNPVGRFQLIWGHDTARYWLLPTRAASQTRRLPVHNRPDYWSRHRTSRRSRSRKLTLL